MMIFFTTFIDTEIKETSQFEQVINMVTNKKNSRGKNHVKQLDVDN